MAGIDHAAGEVIVTLDADLQMDPADIPICCPTLAEGYDVVSGWRAHRQDAAISRNFVSCAANRVISRISGVRLHDHGCTLKAYRREVLEGMRLYGEDAPLRRRSTPPGWAQGSLKFRCVITRVERANRNTAGTHSQGHSRSDGGQISVALSREADSMFSAGLPPAACFSQPSHSSTCSI